MVLTRAKQLALVAAFSVLAVLPASAFSYTPGWSFPAAPGGNSPQVPPVLGAGGRTLYGTTHYGGHGCGSQGCGTIYSVTPYFGSLNSLHSFTGFIKGDVDYPSKLVPDGSALLGTTNDFYRKGQLFSFNPSKGTYTPLHNFTSAATGQAPLGVLLDSSHNMWGTTYLGGSCNTGVIWEIASGGTYDVIHSFGGCMGSTDGYYAEAGLYLDASRNLWGTTTEGGTGTNCPTGSNGCGVVFEYTAGGSYQVVYNFGVEAGDGYYSQSLLVADSSGNIWGTTLGGGAYGGGTVFEIDTGGHYTLVHSFGASNDGTYPHGLTTDSHGNLWGTTEFGGGPSAYCSRGCGTIYEIKNSAAYSVTYNFGVSIIDGRYPSAEFSPDSSGNLWSTTYGGGSNGTGTIFDITP